MFSSLMIAISVCCVVFRHVMKNSKPSPVAYVASVCPEASRERQYCLTQSKSEVCTSHFN